MSRPLPLLEKQDLRPQAIETALFRLGQATQDFWARLLKACAAAVERDGHVTLAESELLRAFAQSLGCSAPWRA
jgi:hypothetical protein